MKKPPKITRHHVFTFASEADLSAQIASFRVEHEAVTGERLAMDAKQPLGAGKARVTFRVVGVR